MGTEQLYFIIGFLLGLLITGCLTIAAAIIYYESLEKKDSD
jgi:hypothetical protein